MFFTKTLSILDLQYTGAGDEGIKYLADAIKSNTVIQNLSLICNHVFSYRPLPNLILDTIDLEMMRQCI